VDITLKAFAEKKPLCFVRGRLYVMILAVALILYVLSVFSPLILEEYRIRGVYTGGRWVWEYQSYQVLVRGKPAWMFDRYWFRLPQYNLWKVVFVFQILTIIFGVMAMFKRRIKGKVWHLIVLAAISWIAPFLVIHQYLNLRPYFPVELLFYSVRFREGMWLEVASACLFSILPLIEARTLRYASKRQRITSPAVWKWLSFLFFTIGVLSLLEFNYLWNRYVHLSSYPHPYRDYMVPILVFGIFFLFSGLMSLWRGKESKQLLSPN